MDGLAESVTTITSQSGTDDLEKKSDGIQTGLSVDDERTILLKIGEWTVAYRGEKLSDELLHAIERFPADWEELERPSSYAWNQDGEKKYFLKDRPMLPFLQLKKYGSPIKGGYLSVGMELALSKRISEVLAQATVQEFVKEKGFKGIRYIEPLCALIPQQKPESPRKSVIYPFVQDAIDIYSRFDVLGNISDFLKRHLRDAGIEPEDLNIRQFIIDAEGMLWLIDTEGYLPISSNGKDE